MMRTFLSSLFAFVLLTAAVMPAAKAGGPFYTAKDADGKWIALRWLDNKLEYYVEGGDLSAGATTGVTNAEARGWISDAFDNWTRAKLKDQSDESRLTVDMSTRFMGMIKNSANEGIDINADNFANYYNDSETRTIIVFDKDGLITKSLLFDENTTIGLSTPTAVDSSGLRITKGIVVFNGLLLDNGKMTKEKFQATVLHELGHLLNLDHSVVNYGIARTCGTNAACVDGNFIPTMYPIEITDTQSILSADDIVALSWQNPSNDFKADFCTITGEIYDAKERPLKGVHVVAARLSEDAAAKSDVRGFVSGAMAPVCEGDSRYYLYGIIPGVRYQVTYEAIPSEFKGASALEPLAERSPTGFSGGQILLPSGESVVTCDGPGKVIDMAAATIDTANPCSSNAPAPDPEEAVQTKTAKCGVMPLGGAWQISAIFVALMLGAKLMARRKRTGLPSPSA